MALTPYAWHAEPAAQLALLRERLPNAVLLYGAPGTGVFELGRAFATSLLCESPAADGTPCGRCRGCELVRAGSHPDFKPVVSEFMANVFELPYVSADNERSGDKKKLSREVRIHQVRALTDFIGLAANRGGKGNVEKSIIRTQRDLSMKIIAIGSIITLILIVLFFYLDVMQGNLLHTLVAIVLVAGISFLFTTVAANAIAIVGTNPVSGMTLMTLILASVVMVAVGLKGPSGMVAALVMGGVVCTALSMAGGFITDLKIGYWLGSTPAKQETWKFLGTIVSAATVGGVMIILNKTYGFTSGALAAPQANAMAAVIEPLMSGVGAPWLLYGIGAVLAIILTLCKIPALAFALGMFIPLELNVPLVVGGAVNWFVTTRSKDASLNTERGEKGTLLASGFIAGGALMGVISAAMRFGGINLVNEAWLNNTWSEVLALGAYALLILYFIKASMKVK